LQAGGVVARLARPRKFFVERLCLEDILTILYAIQRARKSHTPHQARFHKFRCLKQGCCRELTQHSTSSNCGSIL
jgi:hypothetical protein